MKTIKLCETCHQLFGFMRGQREKFCSQKCKQKSQIGKRLSYETRRRMSKAKIGKPRSEEFKKKLSIHNKREGNPRWKGGRITSSSGYILIKTTHHPFANNHGYISEHRLLMEKVLGRYLNPSESVHHINGRRDDNRIENLLIFGTDSEHSKHHWKNPEFREKMSNRKRRKKAHWRKF